MILYRFTVASLVAGIVALPQVGAAQARPLQIGLSAGLEFHSDWHSSVLGPTFAIMINRLVSSRLQLGGVLTASGRGFHGGDDVTLAPATDLILAPADPGLALGGAVDLTLYDHPGGRGGYALMSAGMVHFSSSGLRSVMRPQLAGGVGGAIPAGNGMVFIEARAVRILNADEYPRWLVPLRVGWRFRI